MCPTVISCVTQRHLTLGLCGPGTCRLPAPAHLKGKDYVWAIVLDCQRADVTASASRLLMDHLYGKGGKKELIRWGRAGGRWGRGTRLM